MEDCPSASQLTAFLSGLCDGEDAVEIEDHLADCEDCCQWCMDHDSKDQLLDDVRVVLDTPGPLSDDSGGSGDDNSGFNPFDAPAQASPQEGIPLVDGYKILEELGRGGMGVVYRAYQESTKREVALKVLLQGEFASTRTKRRFEREVELAASLDHPHIVTILESGIARGRYYFAMQFVEGRTLDEYARGDAVTIRDLSRLFCRVCDAINYAHQRGVLHRDLKPSNIVVNEAGEPHILDFGLAKVHDPDSGPIDESDLISMPGELMGTLPYLSPEHVTGSEADVDVRSDVYALGVMFFRVLTGRYPYSVSGRFQEVLDNIAKAEPSRPSNWRQGVDDDLDTILLKTLSKERERRYQSAGEVARDLDRWLSGEMIEAKRDSQIYVLRKLVHRARVPIAIGTIVLVLGLLATIGWLSRKAARDRNVARTILASFVAETEDGYRTAQESSQAVQSLIRESLSDLVDSASYADRVTGARGAILMSPEVFWDSVNGGELWKNGEWVELATIPVESRAEIIASLRDTAASGSDQQKYVAFCLLGYWHDGLHADVGVFCSDAAMQERHPGVVAAAAWAARQFSLRPERSASPELFEDDLSGLTFVRVPGSDGFRAGPRLDDEMASLDELPGDPVTINSFLLAKTEIPFSLFNEFLETPLKDSLDAEKIRRWYASVSSLGNVVIDDESQAAAGIISLNTARRICAWLSERGAVADPPRRYRLPTEDEWEHAARGGNDGRFCYGMDTKYLQYFGNCRGLSDAWPQVATRFPNFYGLHDMHGSLWEICDSRYPEELAAIMGVKDVTLWTLKGGAYYNPAAKCRVSTRSFAEAHVASEYNGTRLVMELIIP
ncbi:MAG: protein kinase domain-containing protein [Planctomycetota bacterium]|jgi:serine/threonine protein kinase/formylglycine-generating enzyme required for sulfatase activity